MYGKSNMETCIAICKIGAQREFSVWLRRLKQGFCIKLRGGKRQFRKEGDICIPMADSC